MEGLNIEISISTSMSQKQNWSSTARLTDFLSPDIQFYILVNISPPTSHQLFRLSSAESKNSLYGLANTVTIFNRQSSTFLSIPINHVNITKLNWFIIFSQMRIIY